MGCARVRTADAVVIGSGHNSLITAAELTRAGWDVVVVERNDEIGGATRSGEVTLPGLEHDIFATNINLFLGNEAFAELGNQLQQRGFEPAVANRAYSNIFPDGKSLRVYSDPERTEQMWREHNPKDLVGWRQLREKYHAFMTALMPLYSTPLPSFKTFTKGVQAVRAAGTFGTLELARILAASTRELGDRWFATPEAKALIATWGMHMDFGPDVSGGGMFPFVETFTDMEQGIAITKGGISRLPQALAALIKDNGGEIRTGTAVAQVLTDGDRATGVRTADGEEIRARRAVVAGTTPTQLFGELMNGDGGVDEKTRTRALEYRYGPGTMMIHLALDRPVQWSAADDLSQFAYVHVAPYVDDLARTYQQAMAGLIPDSPLLIVGQTSQVDPSRSSDGRQILWVQVRALPSTIRGDSKEEIAATDWDEAKEQVADRVMAKLESYAPGLASTVLARTVLSPLDLERSNPNLVGGDSVAGSHHLWQNFVFRPWPGASTYQMPVKQLYLVGAATWPGAGTNGVSGMLCARRVLNPHPYRTAAIRTGVAAASVGAGAAMLARRAR